jgi:GT2 family glycosyltransferase
MTDWKDKLKQVNATKEPSKVVLAYLHPGEVAQSFHGSVLDTLIYDQGRRFTGPDGRPMVLASKAGANGIVQGRNSAVAEFLDTYQTADLLMFVDADMGWDPDAVEYLASVMDETGLPIVGGLCFGVKEAPVVANTQRAHEPHIFPTLYAWNTIGEAAFDTQYDYPPDALVEVSATGGAFLMLHRTCLEKIRAAEGDNWFTPIITEGRSTPFGEDMSFCLRARSYGEKVHVHTGVKTSHKKTVWVTEQFYRDLRSPASSAVSVVIPVKDNLEMTRDLVGQLVNQGGITDVLLFDNGSTDPDMVEWLAEQTEATVFDASESEGISQMWNAGIDEALTRHHGLADIVFLNNDIRLGPRAIRRLIAGLRSVPQMQAVCPNYDGRPGTGVSPLKGICAGRYDGSGGLAGFAFALRSEWIASGFRFDEDMAWFFSDNDLCLQIEKAGGWYGMVHESRCMHIDGGSLTERPPDWDERTALDRKAFEAKWPQVELVSA